MTVRPAKRIALLIPTITLILAATAIPVELRPVGRVKLDFGIYPDDVIENIAGYVPVGIVLAHLGPLQSLVVSGVLSAFAETTQFAMMHRVPSAIDLATNVIGALLGIALSKFWKISSPGFGVNRWTGFVAASLAIVLVFVVRAMSGDTSNPRGDTSPGRLEAYWKLDGNHGRVTLDSSGHGLNGHFENNPVHVSGEIGNAILLHGPRDYIDIGHSTALRLSGSMTISAWINPMSFPADDAAIVSQLQDGFGYQLDTTVDRGPRTIGFKLTGECGELIARYGATPLRTNTWYHVAGVYNAQAQTLDVYLNGNNDNGFLLGKVTGTQRSSQGSVYIGRRSDSKGFEFAGAIDDVRIYSVALTQPEIVQAMRRKAAIEPLVNTTWHSSAKRTFSSPCAVLSDPEVAKIPGAAAALGALVAIACICLLPSVNVILCGTVSFASGLLLLSVTPTTLPVFNLWLLPLVTLAGAMSVALSVRR